MPATTWHSRLTYPSALEQRASAGTSPKRRALWSAMWVAVSRAPAGSRPTESWSLKRLNTLHVKQSPIAYLTKNGMTKNEQPERLKLSVGLVPVGSTTGSYLELLLIRLSVSGLSRRKHVPATIWHSRLTYPSALEQRASAGTSPKRSLVVRYVGSCQSCSRRHEADGELVAKATKYFTRKAISKRLRINLINAS